MIFVISALLGCDWLVLGVTSRNPDEESARTRSLHTCVSSFELKKSGWRSFYLFYMIFIDFLILGYCSGVFTFMCDGRETLSCVSPHASHM